MGSRDAEWDPAGSGRGRGSTFGRRLRTMNSKKNAKRALPLLFLTGLLTLAASAGARPAWVHVGIRVGGARAGAWWGPRWPSGWRARPGPPWGGWWWRAGPATSCVPPGTGTGRAPAAG